MSDRCSRLLSTDPHSRQRLELRDLLEGSSASGPLPYLCVFGQFWWWDGRDDGTGDFLPWGVPFQMHTQLNRVSPHVVFHATFSSAADDNDSPPLRAEGGKIAVGVYLKNGTKLKPIHEEVLRVPVLPMSEERIRFADGGYLPGRGGGWKVVNVDLRTADSWEKRVSSDARFSSYLDRASLIFGDEKSGTGTWGYVNVAKRTPRRFVDWNPRDGTYYCYGPEAFVLKTVPYTHRKGWFEEPKSYPHTARS